MKALGLLWLLALPGWGESLLDQLVTEQRKVYSKAFVSSGFYDSRGISRYRSQPGLHAGYDIAMPAGSQVRAAWPGTVRAVIPWAPGEWGVEIMHADGTTATYGHVTPLTEVGRSVTVGQVVGLVARDHVDVKMRDGNGTLFDYAAGYFSTARGKTPPPSLAPSPRSLAWQRRWRAFNRRPLDWKTPDQLRILTESGCRSGPVPAPVADLAELRQSWRDLSASERGLLKWDRAEKEGLAEWTSRLRQEEKRYELGLSARNKMLKIRAIQSFWVEILRDSLS